MRPRIAVLMLAIASLSVGSVAAQETTGEPGRRAGVLRGEPSGRAQRDAARRHFQRLQPAPYAGLRHVDILVLWRWAEPGLRQADLADPRRLWTAVSDANSSPGRGPILVLGDPIST